jgi:hypothetical protein
MNMYCMFMYTLHYINTSQELTTDFIAECHFTEDGSCPCWGLALEAFGCLSSTLQISCPESMLAMYLWNLPNAINHCFLLKHVWHRPQIDDTYTVLYIYIIIYTYTYVYIYIMVVSSTRSSPRTHGMPRSEMRKTLHIPYFFAGKSTGNARHTYRYIYIITYIYIHNVHYMYYICLSIVIYIYVCV